MKLNKRVTGLMCGATIASMFTATLVRANGLPLQVGVYRIGSNYIQIAAKGTRLCYNGFSARGSAVGSISADPGLAGFYRVNGINDVVLYQPDLNTLFYGAVNQLNAYPADREFPRELSGTLRECLDASGSFFRRQTSTR